MSGLVFCFSHAPVSAVAVVMGGSGVFVVSIIVEPTASGRIIRNAIDAIVFRDIWNSCVSVASISCIFWSSAAVIMTAGGARKNMNLSIFTAGNKSASSQTSRNSSGSVAFFLIAR